MVTNQIDSLKVLNRLKVPTTKVDVVLDTDAFNEIDDQFALAYLLRSKDKLTTQAIYSAPFQNYRAETPEIGMNKSFDEIINILELMKEHRLKQVTFKGSRRYLSDENTFVESDAARDLAERAMNYTEQDPLYVIGLAALTNIASAILINPDIVNRIVVIWLGGNSFDWHDNWEFNIKQDVTSARLVFDSGVPIILLPCMGVVSSFTTTKSEIEYWLKGKNDLCDYLVDKTIAEGESREKATSWSRVIWDVTAVAWLLDGEFMLDRIEHSPIANDNHTWSFDKRRHLIKYVYHINRDLLFEDLFSKLASSY